MAIGPCVGTFTASSMAPSDGTGGVLYGSPSATSATYRRRAAVTTYGEKDQTYSYDLLGHLTGATAGTYGLTFGYDALGRRTGASNSSFAAGTYGYQYDAAGRRTRLTWGDGFYVTYDYDAADEMTAIRENGSLALASFAYDNLARRASLTRANGVVTSYGYDTASQLTSLGLNLAGTSDDQSYYNITYNAAGQIVSRSTTNGSYAWTGGVAVSRGYVANGLNQYTASGGTTLGYDGRGNLTSSGNTAYRYTVDNQLATATGITGLRYNALGQLFDMNSDGGVDTVFTYAGAEITSEINASTGALLRRYVAGPGSDEPLVWYEGTGTSDRRYLVADERGSVVAVTDGAGSALAINGYDEYGLPSATSATYRGRFGYTGQAWLPSLGLWYYKARMYSPTLGRFLQTDPVGYGDGLNWYTMLGLIRSMVLIRAVRYKGCIVPAR